MENNLFIQRLKELADIKRIKPPGSSGIRKGEESNEIFRNGELRSIGEDHNDTWAYQIKQLKPIVKPCEDCGVECKNRVVNKTLYIFPKRHWRTHCSVCNRVQNPETKQFDLLPMKAQSHFISFFKKK
jgi:hypothetical protein